MEQQTTHARPFYAPLTGSGDNDASSSEESIPLTAPPSTEVARKQQQRRRQRQRVPPCPATPSSGGARALLPTARRFWADFTLGFADGLTVPFALTAGLSSLGGRTDTVVYAGMAEVSAGCISMGIGGYLSARPAAAAAAAAAAASTVSAPAEQKERRRRRGEPEAPSAAVVDVDTTEAMADRYLAPLGLPRNLHRRAVAHVVAGGPQAAQALRREMAYDEEEEGDDDDDDDDDNDNNDNDDPVWPVAAGLSVALGYLVGGLLPLGPYFAAASVGTGLRWSFAVCLVALFGFGAARDFFLEGGAVVDNADDDDDGADDADADETDDREKAQLPWARRRRLRRRIPWRRLRKSAGEGLQMVVLGGIAAVAAVLCVRLFESGSGGSGGGGGGGGAAEEAASAATSS